MTVVVNIIMVASLEWKQLHQINNISNTDGEEG